MKKWKLFLLGAGYIAGLLVALKFGKDGKGKDLKALAEDAKAIHTNLFTQAEELLFSEENKARLVELKDSLTKELAKFEKELAKKSKEWKKLGTEKAAVIEQELKEMYENRKEILEDLKEKALEALDEGKEKSVEVLDEVKDRAESFSKEGKKELEKIYKKIKKELE